MNEFIGERYKFLKAIHNTLDKHLDSYWTHIYFSDFSNRIKSYSHLSELKSGSTVYETATLTDTVYTSVVFPLDELSDDITVPLRVSFVYVEILTNILPFPEEVKTSFLSRLSSTTFRNSSPYARETLYFYNISGAFVDVVNCVGGDIVAVSKVMNYIVVVVSDKGWYQVVY